MAAGALKDAAGGLVNGKAVGVSYTAPTAATQPPGSAAEPPPEDDPKAASA